MLLAIGVYLVSLAWLTLAAAGPGTVWWDEPVQRDARALDGPGWDVAADVGNWLGLTVVGLVILAIAAVACVARHHLLDAALLGGVALIRALNWPLKWVFDSPRPGTTAEGTNDVASGLGYPSGHAMGTMLIGGALLIIVFRGSTSPGIRAASVLAVTTGILATGYGRVVTRAHWPSDVIGGWLWGVGLLGIVTVLVGVAGRHWASRLDHGPGRPT